MKAVGTYKNNELNCKGYWKEACIGDTTQNIETKETKQIFEEQDKDDTYSKTIKYPPKYYEKNKEHKLVKTKH